MKHERSNLYQVPASICGTHRTIFSEAYKEISTLSTCKEEHQGFWLKGDCIGCGCAEESGKRVTVGREFTNRPVHPDPFKLEEDVGVSTRITPPSKFPFCLFYSSLPPPSSPKSLLLFVPPFSLVPPHPLPSNSSLSSSSSFLSPSLFPLVFFPSSIPQRRLRQAPTSVTREGLGGSCPLSQVLNAVAASLSWVPSPLQEACFQSSDRQLTAPAPPFQNHPFGK